MWKIAYDGTYMLKGLSGIPTDAISTLKSLVSISQGPIDVYFFDAPPEPPNKNDQSEVNRKENKLSKLEILRRIILRILFMLPYASNLFNFFIRNIFRIRRILLIFKLNIDSFETIKTPIFLQKKIRDFEKIKCISVKKTSLERFLPVKILKKSLYLNTNQYDFFIQQQIDPISISENTKHIIRLHDILPITHPHFFTSKAKSAFKTGLYSLLKDDEKIWVMDTQASADEFQTLFGKSRNVKVIPCVVGDKYENLGKQIFKKENIILMVNTIEPRKNVDLVIEAFLSLIAQNNLDKTWKLLIAGSPGWKSKKLVDNLRLHGPNDRISYVESPDDLEVLQMYAKAKFVISASEAEGFGLPPLEGMKFECIPLVSDISQHRETIGKNAIYFGISKTEIMSAVKKAVSEYERYKTNWVQENKNRIDNLYNLTTISAKWTEILQEEFKR